MRVPRIAITPGEPAGIGPELCAALASGHPGAELVLVADPGLLRERADLDPPSYDPLSVPEAGALRLLPVSLAASSRPGHLDPDNASYVLTTLERACDGCLCGEFQALVTGPVHKGVINEAGRPFTGHTEFLAERTGGWPVMMLIAPGLRVALATTHLALRAVPDALTRGRLERVLRILHRDLQTRFGVTDPRILVCGLNPHAGEGGHLGREEIEVIGPVLEALRGEGIHLLGPLPADTLFTPRHLERADAVLAQYHDQGLPVLKHLGFGRAVNVTLGLPIVRTSVDHGVALDLAGSGQADPGSLCVALDLAIDLGRR